MTTGPQSPACALSLEWDGCNRTVWEKLQSRADDLPLEQSWMYGEAIAGFPRYRVRRGVLSAAGRPLGIVQAFERRIPVLGTLVRITRGPVWLSPSNIDENLTEGLKAVHRSWRLRDRRPNFWMPELPAGADSMAALAATGARRMVTGYSTVRIDLTQDEEALRAAMYGDWRNSLKRAERARMKIDISRGGPPLDWLVRNYDGHRRRAGYVGPPPELIRGCAAAAGRGELLVLRALAGREPAAGILVLRHGPSATLFIAWSGETGRRLKAQNLLHWRAVQELKSAGARWFDLGGINADAAPGVARFKLGLGGELRTLAGTFI